MKKITHANVSKVCGLPRLSVVLHFPQSINPHVAVKKWPSGEFTLRVGQKGEKFELLLETSEKTEALSAFHSESDARAALNDVYEKIINRRVRTFVRWCGYAVAGLAAWTALLFAYGIFVTFGPSAAHSARASLSQAGEAQVSSNTNNPVVLPQLQEQPQQASQTTGGSLGSNPMGTLAERALADVQAQAALEQEKIAAQVRAQGAPQINEGKPSGSGGDVNDAFAAAKK